MLSNGKGVMLVQLNEQQVVKRFLELVKINAPSHQERPVADYLLKALQEYGLEAFEDDAGQRALHRLNQETVKTLGQAPKTGNLIAFMKGNQEGVPALMFTAHMDTVVPNKGIRPIEQDGVIKTDGKTILGADDRSGICAILEAIRYLQENDVPHGDLQFVFTIAEETGLFGSLYLEEKNIRSQYAFVMDSGGPPDTIITQAPTEVDFTVRIFGKAAHSGVNPEDGLNAISVAADALANLTFGRIDEETTSNIGIIKGGERTNIVCDRCEINGEVRSRNDQKLNEQIAKIRTAFDLAVEKWSARMDFEEEKIYLGFNLTEADEVVRLAMEGVRKAGLEPKLAPRGGGSDTNNLNAKGIPAVNLGVGATKDHTVEESLKVKDLIDATRLVIGIIQTAAERTEVKSR
ncbi:M20/M25/M40 family metallo-hydrolase [Tumebacillus lipolyticus]|uniref:M20/M25/M40 family metallo-hydrolase n=1 Tax=Tumebacillus lipolyticus TaxID=1280370 RepID=A0ABW4ZSV2_9BACL